jgi:pimeloyl-ACP methyl ester carboxylesterase
MEEGTPVNTCLDANEATAFKQIYYVQLPNGETYAYRKAGNKEKVLLLVHGNNLSGAYYAHLVPLLAPYFTLIAPDLRGFGHSTDNKPLESHADLADDIKLLVDALKIPKCSLVGMSMGGGPIFLFAVKYPEITEKIIFLASLGPKGALPADITALPKNREEAVKNSPMATMAQQFIDLKNKEGFGPIFSAVWGKLGDEYLNTICEDALLQRNLANINWINAHFNVSNEENQMHQQGNNLAAKFDKKALIIAGENDMMAPLEMQQAWKKFLGDNAILKSIPDYGHGPRMDQVKETANIITKFLMD